ncbi:MAG: tetratricopeptide repeat protein [Acidobacteriota bacterium]|jgi:Tol biopolymer transport system component
MARALLTWATAITATAVALGMPVQSGHDLFQQALVKERAEGHLQEAIDLYDRIVRDFPDDHALAAKALVQMGQCYEKLGKAEAKKAYERVIREYPDQAEPLQVALTRLAALRPPPRHDMSVRKIWADSRTDVMGEVSPDGRHLSFVDWETGNLDVRDLATGEIRRLTDEGSLEDPSEFALCSRWSPDGKRIAYDWYRPSGRFSSNEIRVVALGDGRPRVLFRGDEKTSVLTADWSPDGREILVIIHSDPLRLQQLAAISVADGAIRVIKNTDFRYPSGEMAGFSPDGRYIVYSRPSGERGLSSDVFVLSADGRNETRLVAHPANDIAAGWSPDGRWVVFVSDRTGTLDLWMIPVEDGKPAGEPRLVKTGTGRIFPLGFDARGRYYYGTHSRGSDIFTVALDPTTGQVVSTPHRAIERFQGLNDWPSYSRDGAYMAYVSARGSVTSVRPRFSVLCIRALETGQEREFRTDFRRLAGPLFSADGNAVFVGAWDNDKSMGIHRVDVETGVFSLVVKAEEGSLLSGHAPSPDGKRLYYSGCDEESCWIRSRDLASQSETQIYGGPRQPLSMALSPDGKDLAFMSLPLDSVEAERAVRIVPVDGGTPRGVFHFKEHGQHWIKPEFSVDGKYLLVPRETNPPAEPPWTLLRVPVAGGQAEDLGLRMADLGRIAAHPDGGRIAFASKGFERKDDEVWVIGDFLPETKTGD